MEHQHRTHKKFNAERTARICDLFERGIFARTVCDLEGIGVSTYHTWLDKGRKHLEEHDDDAGGNEYADFYRRVKAAQASVEDRMVQCVLKAAEGSEDLKLEYTVNSDLENATREDWRLIGATAMQKSDARAAIEFLKRRYPEEWGDRQKVDATTQVHIKRIEIVDEEGREVDMFGAEEKKPDE